MVITDLGVFTIGAGGMMLSEMAPGVSLDEIRPKTEATFALGPASADPDSPAARGAWGRRCHGADDRRPLPICRGNSTGCRRLCGAWQPCAASRAVRAISASISFAVSL